MTFQAGNLFHLDRKKFGRDAIFKTEEALSSRIQEYFLDCAPHIAERPGVIPMVKEMRGRGKEKVEKIRPPKRGESPNHWLAAKENYVTEEKPLTVTGLAVWLDTNRQTLLNYTKKDAFFDTISRAKALIHQFAEQSLWEPKITSGIIFNLKNNWNWKDQSEVINTPPETGYEHLTKEQIKQKLDELRRKHLGQGPRRD